MLALPSSAPAAHSQPPPAVHSQLKESSQPELGSQWRRNSRYLRRRQGGRKGLSTPRPGAGKERQVPSLLQMHPSCASGKKPGASVMREEVGGCFWALWENHGYQACLSPSWCLPLNCICPACRVTSASQPSSKASSGIPFLLVCSLPVVSPVFRAAGKSGSRREG